MNDQAGAEQPAAQDPPGPEAAGRAPSHGISRRGLFAGIAGAGLAGLAVGGGAGAGAALGIVGAGATGAGGQGTVYPVYGEHQAGIVTPAQDRLHFASFDLRASASRDDLIGLLKDWTAAAVQLTAGQAVGATGAVDGPLTAPPSDTGEAQGLPPSGLTLTFGFGPSLFQDASGADRFGLASRRPEVLQRLPRFTGDALQPELSDGDLCIQACADDPQVAVHAIRNLSRIAFGRATLRWSQLGFGRTSSTTRSQSTPRNLFGFKDGTANLKAEDGSALTDYVWVQPGDGPDWMIGGSYLAVRKIRMTIEVWDRQQLGEQENVIGRDKGEGAPLSGGTEFTEPDFAATGGDGRPLIPMDAHVRLAHPSNNGGVQLLRRGYNYVDGNDQYGLLDAGLFFLSFQRRPQDFITVQSSLARDGMAEYIKHVGSALFAIPPGVPGPGSFIGAGLFA